MKNLKVDRWVLSLNRWLPKEEWEVKISWHLCAFCGTTCGQFVVTHWGHSVSDEGWVERANSPHLKMYVRNRWSPIHISNRSTSKLHILNKSDTIVHWVFAYIICDNPSFDAGLNGHPSNCYWNISFLDFQGWYDLLANDYGLMLSLTISTLLSTMALPVND